MSMRQAKLQSVYFLRRPITKSQSEKTKHLQPTTAPDHHLHLHPATAHMRHHGINSRVHVYNLKNPPEENYELQHKWRKLQGSITQHRNSKDPSLLAPSLVAVQKSSLIR